MIIAELKGKIPGRFYDKEDILTSNVFSFFKYSDRQIFRDYLGALGITVSPSESRDAEFYFWQCYEDNTEPDLVVLCGKYYMLFEAKLYSDFSHETDIVESQMEREIKMGKMSARNLKKEFVYIVLTAEYFKDKFKYTALENRDFLFIWTNWQFIAYFLNEKLENGLPQYNEFANDLYSLLVKKRLRSFVGISNINMPKKFFLGPSVFYNLELSKFKGEFTGFYL
jgi:hypothetical protein